MSVQFGASCKVDGKQAVYSGRTPARIKLAQVKLCFLSFSQLSAAQSGRGLLSRMLVVLSEYISDGLQAAPAHRSQDVEDLVQLCTSRLRDAHTALLPSPERTPSAVSGSRRGADATAASALLQRLAAASTQLPTVSTFARMYVTAPAVGSVADSAADSAADSVIDSERQSKGNAPNRSSFVPGLQLQAERPYSEAAQLAVDTRLDLSPLNPLPPLLPSTLAAAALPLPPLSSGVHIVSTLCPFCVCVVSNCVHIVFIINTAFRCLYA